MRRRLFPWKQWIHRHSKHELAGFVRSLVSLEGRSECLRGNQTPRLPSKLIVKYFLSWFPSLAPLIFLRLRWTQATGGSFDAHLIIHNFSCLKTHLAIFSPSIKSHSSLSDDIVSEFHPIQLQWTTISYHWVSLPRLFSLSSTPSIIRWKYLSLGV